MAIMEFEWLLSNVNIIILQKSALISTLHPTSSNLFQSISFMDVWKKSN